MEDASNRQRLFEALEVEIKKDRSKTKILQISEFGLIEMTRKRVRQSLERSLTQACPYCGGSGRIKSNTTIALEVWRELMKQIGRASCRERGEMAGKRSQVHEIR